MTVIRDTTCDLIERPGARASSRRQSTPHADAYAENIGVAGIAATTLTGMGCLIDDVRITAEQIEIRLTRGPMPGVLERHAVAIIDTPSTRTIHWRGVLITWPIRATDVERAS